MFDAGTLSERCRTHSALPAAAITTPTMSLAAGGLLIEACQTGITHGRQVDQSDSLSPSASRLERPQMRALCFCNPPDELDGRGLPPSCNEA
jgi:hypothetical protein